MPEWKRKDTCSSGKGSNTDVPVGSPHDGICSVIGCERDFVLSGNKRDSSSSQQSSSSGLHASASPDRDCSAPPSAPSPTAERHAKPRKTQQAGAHVGAGTPRCGGAKNLALCGDAYQVGRAHGGGRPGHANEDSDSNRVSGSGPAAESSQRQEDQPHEVRNRDPGPHGEAQCDNPADPAGGHLTCLCQGRTRCYRPRGVREVRRQHLRGHLGQGGLPQVGVSDGQGGRMRSTSPTIGQLVGERTSTPSFDTSEFQDNREGQQGRERQSSKSQQEEPGVPRPEPRGDREVNEQPNRGCPAGDDGHHEVLAGRSGRTSSRPGDAPPKGSIGPSVGGAQHDDRWQLSEDQQGPLGVRVP